MVVAGRTDAGVHATGQVAHIDVDEDGLQALLDDATHARLRRCPPVPTTSVYSRSDGVVAWQACVQAAGRGRFENIEVQSSHLGLGWNAQVFDIIADRLVQPVAKWRPYQPAGSKKLAMVAKAA